MALKATLTLAGSAAEYGSALSLSKQGDFTHTNTSGMSRDGLSAFTVAAASGNPGLSSGKLCQIAITDGDLDVPDAQVHAGQFIDITDNYGVMVRYVFVNGNGSGGSLLADKATVAAASNIGDSVTPTTLKKLNLVGGVAIRIADGDQQRDILEKLRVVINAAEGHNGSISATAVPSEANGIQVTLLTSRDSLAPPNVDNVNSTFSILQNVMTNSQADHVRVIKKGEYTAPAVLYISNNAGDSATLKIIYLYFNDLDGTTFMEIRGGQFAYIPVDPQHDLFAYASTADAIIDYAVFGTQA